MGRPTEEKKDRIVKLRISEDLYNELTREGKNLSETIRSRLKGASSPKNKKADDFVPQNELPYGIQRVTLDDLATMCSFMGGDLNTMLNLFDEAANAGEIFFENGRLMGKPPIRLDGFLEACREVGADPQKVLDKATAGIRR